MNKDIAKDTELLENDEGVWNTVINFTKVNKNGIPIKDLLNKLHTFDNSNSKN